MDAGSRYGSFFSPFLSCRRRSDSELSLAAWQLARSEARFLCELKHQSPGAEDALALPSSSRTRRKPESAKMCDAVQANGRTNQVHIGNKCNLLTYICIVLIVLTKVIPDSAYFTLHSCPLSSYGPHPDRRRARWSFPMFRLRQSKQRYCCRLGLAHTN